MIRVFLKNSALFKIIAIFSGLFLFFTVNSQQVFAVQTSDWRAGNIIDDAVFFDTKSSSVAEINSIIQAKVPSCDRNRPEYFTYDGTAYGPPWTCLKEYQENPTTKETNIARFNTNGTPYNVPGGQSAAQIIYDAGIVNGINPRVLLVMLEKETGLVSDTWAAGWQYKRAMGYGCPDSGPGGSANCDSTYYGFHNQVNKAAWQLKRYTTNPNEYNFRSGVTRNILWNVAQTNCGSGQVFIENAATAALYNYTPYQPNQAALNNLYDTGDGCSAYGNRNFWRLFNDWFGTSRVLRPFAWSVIDQEIFSDPQMTNKLSGTPTIAPGASAYARLTVRNMGNSPWTPDTIFLGTSSPLDRQSAFKADTWVGVNRAAPIKQPLVAPYGLATIEYKITAPSTPFTYAESFNMVREGVSWFDDIGQYFIINVVMPKTNQQDSIIIAPSTQLNRGDYRLSPDGHTVLNMQGDGNLVLYRDGKPVWHTNSANSDIDKFIFQNDGNLVLYNAAGQPLWASGTHGNTNASLRLQSDGNLVIYAANNVVLWSSNTSHNPNGYSYVVPYLNPGSLRPGQSLETTNRNRKLIFQNDGNLVLYNAAGQPLWASGTHGKSGNLLSLQLDGNLVLYNAAGQPLWASGTQNR